MKPSSTRKRGKESRSSGATVQIDRRQAAIFFGVVAALILIVALTAYYLSSTGSDSGGNENTVSLNCYNPEHGVTPNGTTQFMFLLENKASDKNVVRFELTGTPENWSVHMDQNMAILQKGESKIAIMTVHAPLNADSGNYRMVVTASSLSFKGEASNAEITVNSHPPASNHTVQTGDNISVNYVGCFKNGTIFDTSVESVAKNKNLPKTGSFKVRDTYSTLDFQANQGKMIKGFDEGVLGMHVGETKVIIVPPDKGYTQQGSALYGKTLYFEVTLEKIG